MNRLGIAFSGGPTASEIVDCVRLAEDLGYDRAGIVAQLHCSNCGAFVEYTLLEEE